MLDANGFVYFSYFMFFAIAVCLPATLVKLFRPVGRPAIVATAREHIQRCMPTVTTTVPDPNRPGQALIRSSVPTYWGTNVHRDYVCGVGV